MDVLKNKIECLKNLNDYTNTIAPKVIQELKSFEPRFKNSGGLYKKTNDAIKNIINLVPKPNGVTCWAKPSEYSYSYIALIIKSSFKTSEYGCEYIEKTIYVWEDAVDVVWEPRKEITYDDSVVAINKMKEIQDKIDVLNKEMSEVKSSIYPVL